MLLHPFVRYAFVFLFFCSSAFAKVPQKTEVLIIGAGLSGLATAYNLKKAGIPYHILEITPHIGGRVRTVHYKFGNEDLYADSGMEEYWESNPAVKIINELKLPQRSDIAASSIVLSKKLEMLGTEDSSVFLKKILGADGYAALQKFKTQVAPMVSQIKASEGTTKPVSPELLKLKDVAFSKWVAAQGLPAKVADWVRISIECEIGTQWDQISALDGLAEFHIFLGKNGEGEKSYRVTGGNEKFTDALSRQIGLNHVSTNQRVNRIVTKNGKMWVYYLDAEKNISGVVQASQVVSTIPLFRLFEVQFEPAISDTKRQAITSQTWGSYFKAHIFLPPAAEKYWTNDKQSFLPILSDSELGVIYDGNPDQKGKTRILSLLITGSFAEAFNLMPLDTVRTTITSALDRTFPGISKEVKGIEFYRYHPRAIAAWPVGRSRFDDLSQELRRPENGVYFAGDFTESSHSDGAFISAARVARQIISARKGGTVSRNMLGHGRNSSASRVSGIKKSSVTR